MEKLCFSDLKIKNQKNGVIYGDLDHKKCIIYFNNKINNFEELKIQEAKIKNYFIKNPPYYNLNIEIEEEEHSIRMIYPAEKKHFEKLKYKKMTKETPEEYIKRVKEVPLWVKNIIEQKTETPVFENEKFLIVNDYKWDRNIDNLYLTLFCKDYNLFSIREITKELLLEMISTTEKVLKNFNLVKEDVLMYFHYKPSYDLLHMHIFNLKGQFTQSQSVGRAILVDDILRNLDIDKNFYKSNTLTFFD